jgi:hypothetical protein
LNELIKDGELATNSVIRLIDYEVNDAQQKVLLCPFYHINDAIFFPIISFFAPSPRKVYLLYALRFSTHKLSVVSVNLSGRNMHSNIQVLEERNEKIQKKGKSPEKSNRFFPCVTQSSNKQ